MGISLEMSSIFCLCNYPAGVHYQLKFVFVFAAFCCGCTQNSIKLKNYAHFHIIQQNVINLTQCLRWCSGNYYTMIAL